METFNVLDRVLARDVFADIRAKPENVARLKQAYAHLIQTTLYFKVLPAPVFEHVLARAILLWQSCMSSPELHDVKDFVGATLRESYAAAIEEWFVDVRAHLPNKLEPVLNALPSESRDEAFSVMRKFLEVYGSI